MAIKSTRRGRSGMTSGPTAVGIISSGSVNVRVSAKSKCHTNASVHEGMGMGGSRRSFAIPAQVPHHILLFHAVGSSLHPTSRAPLVRSPSNCDATLHASPATRFLVHRLTNGYKLQSTALSTQQYASISISHSGAILFMTHRRQILAVGRASHGTQMVNCSMWDACAAA